MGIYWQIVNLDKEECLDPHSLGHGAKFWEWASGGRMMATRFDY